jgi:hypothetical protein
VVGSIDDFLSSTTAQEVVAAVEHERWAHWQQYLHSQCKPMPDGGLHIPRDLVTRWERQASTPYSRLSKKEQESDREQAAEYIAALRRANQEFI